MGGRQSTQRNSISIVSLNTAGILTSPYQYFQREDLESLKLNNLFMIIASLKINQFQNQTFKWGMGSIDTKWKNRFSPFNLIDVGVKYNNKLMSQQQFRQRWDQIYQVTQDIVTNYINQKYSNQYKQQADKKQKLKNQKDQQVKVTKQFDLCCYQTLVLYYYSYQGEHQNQRESQDTKKQNQKLKHFKSQLSLQSQNNKPIVQKIQEKLKNFWQKKSASTYLKGKKNHFNKIFLTEQRKMQKTLSSIQNWNYDIIFLQQVNNIFLNGLKSLQNYTLIKKIPSDSVILIKNKTFQNFQNNFNFKNQNEIFFQQFIETFNNDEKFYQLKGQKQLDQINKSLQFVQIFIEKKKQAINQKSKSKSNQNKLDSKQIQAIQQIIQKVQTDKLKQDESFEAFLKKNQQNIQQMKKMKSQNNEHLNKIIQKYKNISSQIGELYKDKNSFQNFISQISQYIAKNKKILSYSKKQLYQKNNQYLKQRKNKQFSMLNSKSSADIIKEQRKEKNQKQLQQKSILENRLNFNMHSIFQFLQKKYILINVHLNSKDDMFFTQFNEFARMYKTLMKFLQLQKKQYTVIMGGDLNKNLTKQKFEHAFEPLILGHDYHLFPLEDNKNKPLFTVNKKRTYMQPQRQKALILDRGMKDFIISNVNIMQKGIISIDGTMLGSNRVANQPANAQSGQLLPSNNHPYDHYIVFAQLVNQPTIH